jgi:hypothetical protein
MVLEQADADSGQATDWRRVRFVARRIWAGDRPVARAEVRPEQAERERRLGRKLPDRAPERRN